MSTLNDLVCKRDDLVDQRRTLSLECRAPTTSMLRHIDAQIEILSEQIHTHMQNLRGTMPHPRVASAAAGGPAAAIAGAAAEIGVGLSPPLAGRVAVTTAPGRHLRLVDLPMTALEECLLFLKPIEVVGGPMLACRDGRATGASRGLWRAYLRLAASGICRRCPGLSTTQLCELAGEVAGRSRPPLEYFFIQMAHLATLVATAAMEVDPGLGGVGGDRPRRPRLWGGDAGEEEEEEGQDVGGVGRGADRAGGDRHAGRRAAVRRCVLALDRRTYDVTPFLSDHPGGRSNLTRYAGRDASKVFDIYGHR